MEFMDAVVSRIRRRDEMKKLNCSRQDLTDKEVAQVAAVLPTNRGLMGIDLASNHVTDAGVQTLLEGLRGNCTLQTVDLSHNTGITEACVPMLLGVLEYNDTLHSVLLEGTGVTPEQQALVSHRLIINSFPKQVKECLLLLERDSFPPEGIQITLMYDPLDPKVCTPRTVEYLSQAVAGKPVMSFHCVRCLKDINVSRLVAALQGSGLETATFRELGLGCEDMQQAFVRLIEVSPALRSLDLRDNVIGNDGARVVTNALAVSDSLEEVRIEGNNISATYFSRLQAATSLNSLPRVLKSSLPDVLSDSDTLTHLAFQGGECKGRAPGRGYFDNAAARIISEALQRNTHVTEVDLSNNHIGPEGCIPLADLIQASKAIKTLNLSRNIIGDDGAKRLVQALEKNDSVQALALEGCDVSARLLAQVEWLCQLNALPLTLKRLLPRIQPGALCDRSLTVLDFTDLEGRLLGPEGTAVLCGVLKDNKFVVSLNISGNKLGDRGAAHVAKFLQENDSLQTLKLCDNDIGKDGAGLILRSLKYNNTITSINMVANKNIPYDMRDEIDIAVELNFLEPELKETITRLSSSDRTLTQVNLANLDDKHKLTDDLARTLADVLIGNRQVTSILLDGNSVSSIGVGYLCRWLKTAEGALKTLSFNNNELNHDAAQYLCDALQQTSSPAITNLLLKGNSIGQTGGDAVVQLVRNKASLHVVDVRNNQMSPETELMITHICSLNTHCEELKPLILSLIDNSADVTEVDISGVTDVGVLEAVVSGLKASVHIKKLVARRCGLNATTCAAVAAGIRGHPSLHMIDLSENDGIGDFEVHMLADVIEVSFCALRDVVITRDNVSPAVVARLHSATLLASLPAAVAKEMLAAKQRNPTTTSLCFADLDALCGDTICALLSYCLADNDYVKVIKVVNLGVTDVGAAAMAEFIRSCTVLRTVDVSSNPITVKGLQDLVKGAWESNTLYQLGVDGIAALTTAAEEDSLPHALRNKLTAKLEGNKDTLTVTQKYTSDTQAHKRLLTSQLDHYRSKAFLDGKQAEIMQDALHDNGPSRSVYRPRAAVPAAVQ